ncbi:unnamed protein product [Discosporangium mesarthrocarpum]
MTAGVEDRLLYGLITERCSAEFFTDFECQKAVLAKVVGYALILASLTIKAPQIAKIIAGKSVAGLSPSAFYSELIIYIINAVYNMVNGSPISAYGEILTILVQNVVLVVLLWRYMEKPPSRPVLVGLVALFIGIAVICINLPPDMLRLLPFTNLPLIILCKIPQILTNFKNGHTGKLAAVTVTMNFVGTLLRILTTIQEVGWDFSLLSQHILSVLLNCMLFLQILAFWTATTKWEEQQAKVKAKKVD